MKCAICKLDSKKNGKTCGNTECIIALRKQTNLAKYGHECNLHSKDETNKRIAKLKEIYGVENVSQIDWVKEKKKETCRTNFGVDAPMQSSIVREKSIKKCIEKYGVDNVSKNTDIILKIITIKATPDANGVTPNEHGLNKRYDQNLIKYGTWFVQTPEFREKAIATCLDRYGKENYSQTEEFQKWLIDSGTKRCGQSLEDWECYKSKVRCLTQTIFSKYANIICRNYKRSTEYHLDHIYSIYDGFKNSIPPEIISSIVNLQIITAKENHVKNKKSWITKEELLESYHKLKELTIE